MKKAGGGELEEVERALSVLDGRHPEFVRAQRETVQAAKALADEQSKVRALVARRRAVRTLVTIVVVGVVGAAGWLGLRVWSRAHGMGAANDALSAPYERAGFRVLASTGLREPRALDADTVGSTCVVALAAGDAPMTVRHGDAQARGAGSIGWCACGPEHVHVDAGDESGARLVAIEARAIGGLEGWGSLDGSARPRSFAEGGDECREAALVGWIAQRRFPKVATDARWLDDGPGHPLARAGFRAVAGSPPGRRFAVVEADKETCFLAVRAGGTSKDPLVLDDIDGNELAKGAAVAWCDARGRALVVRSDGTTVVLVTGAPGARVGGTLGSREWAARVGLRDVATFLDRDFLAWDAAAALRAGAVPDVVPVENDHDPPADAHLVALSAPRAGTLARDPLAAGAVACAPPLESGAMATVCAQSAARMWRSIPGEALGVAAAPRPFWTNVLGEPRAHDAGALRAEVALAALVRRLASEGFELTIFSGVADAGGGRVAVTGRSGDDAVVVVGVASAAPWVFPYTDGPAWTIDGDAPRVVPLAPEARVTLVASAAPAVPDKQRRVLVFRGKR